MLKMAIKENACIRKEKEIEKKRKEKIDYFEWIKSWTGTQPVPSTLKSIAVFV